MTNLWKRSLSMFLAVVMVIGMLPMNVLAEGIDDTPVCEHVNKTTTVDATCTVDGAKTVTCDDCGEIVSTETILATGHTPGAEATCGEAQICTVCGEVLNAATGAHTPGAEATCGAAQTCTVCGVELATATGAHTPGAEATCDAAQTCTVCGEVLTAALGHNFGGDNKDEKCSVCEAANPDATVAEPTEATESEVDEEVARVQALIDALPTEIKQSEVSKYQARFDEANAAYGALSEAQKAQIVGAEKLNPVITADEVANPVAQIGEVKYEALGAAVAALQNGQTLKILQSFTPGANEFIELNGKTNVTITAAEDVVIDGSISFGYHVSHIDNNVDRSESTLTVKDLTVKGTLTVCSNDANLVVSGNETAQLTVMTYREAMNITVSKNTLDGSIGTAANSYGMYIVPDATGYNLTISDNYFENVNSHAIAIQGHGTSDGSVLTAANSIAVSGNTFESWGTGGKSNRAAFKIWNDNKYAPAGNQNPAAATVAMKDLAQAIGKDNSFNSTASNVVQIDAYGAAGNADAFVPSTPETPAVTYVAEIVNGEKYETLAAAVAAAESGATVTVIADISDEAITVDKNLTITGSNTLTNVSINGTAGELTVSNLTFAGNSWINAGGCDKLVVANVAANVTPSNTTYTNSRSAFIGLGRSEGKQLNLTVTGCNIVVPSGTDAVLGWAAVNEVTISGNTFGSETSYQNGGDIVKFMAIADGAVINITGNTSYSNYNGFVFAQNTTRDNAYTAIVDGNTFFGGADHIWIEVSGSNTVHAKVEATSDNTVNGNAFTANDIKYHSAAIKNWDGYAGVDVTKGTDGKLTGGSFVEEPSAEYIAPGLEAVKNNGTWVLQEAKVFVASVNGTEYETLEEAFAAATEGQTITLLADATPALTSQRAITKAATIDLNGYILTLTEDDLYFGTTTFKNGTIVVDPSVKPSTAVFWMFENQTLTFDAVKIVATGVTGTYLIGLEGTDSNLNLLNGSEILIENTTALDLDVICVNGSSGIVIADSKVNVKNLDGRVFFRGNYTVSGTSEIALSEITKAGFRIEAGQTLSIEGNAKVVIEGEPRDGGIHLTDTTATYTKAETATVNATVNKPNVAKIGEQGYATMEEAFAAATEGQTITLLADATPALTSQRAITKAATIDLNGYTLTLTEDDLYFGTTTFKNGTIVVDPSVKPSTAVFWMFENQTLTFDAVKIVATGVTGTYLIGTWEGSNITIKLQDSSITIANEAMATLSAVICDNGTDNSVVIDGCEINVGNLNGRLYLGGVNSDITVKNSKVNLNGVKEGFYLRAGQSLSIEGNSNVNITLNSNDGRFGINLTDTTATYTKADTATVSATVYKPATLAGSGTQEDPFIVDSLDALKIFRDMVNGGTTFDNQFVKLTADINLNNEAWTPIGNATNKFLGTFDGGNHTISNLKVSVETNNAGLFGFASVIKNVKINNATVSGYIGVGALVGELESSVGTVDNCHVFGTIQITGENSVGGLAGKGYANIKNSSVIGNGAATSFVLGVNNGHEEGDNVGGLMGHLGEGNTLGVNKVTVKNITVKGTRKVGGVLGTTARGNDNIGCVVENVTVECTATVDYANDNKETTTIGGVIGNYFGDATSGGILKDCSVTDVNLVIGNAKSAGALVGGDRKNNGGAPVGVDTVSGNTVTNVTGATNKYLIPAVAQIGDETYATLEEAFAAATVGDEIKLLADVTGDITVPADVIFNGNGFAINGKLTAGGNITFAGITKATLFDIYYIGTTVNIGKGASLQLTGTGRITAGYGCTFNIEGEIVDAKTANKAEVVPSLVIPGGASITGNGGINFNVKNAYISMGSTSSKNSAANGKFTLNFTNTIAEFTNQFTLSAPTNGKTPEFVVNIKDSVFTTATKLCIAAANSTVTVDNSIVTLSTYLRNSGSLILQNGSELTGSMIQFGENGGNDGIITVDASTLTIKNTSVGHAMDGNNTGKLILKNGATASVDYIIESGIEMGVDTSLTSKSADLEIEAEAGYEGVYDNGVYTIKKAPVAMIGETKYETLAAAVAAVQEGQTITVMAGTISEGTIKLPANLKNVTIKGEEGAVLKDTSISASDGNSYSYVGLTFDGLTFDNGRILLTGWRNGEETIENLTVTNCTFKNLNDTTNTAPVHINKDASEAVNGFTFTNNVIDGATGGSKSGVYAQVTGNVIFTGNVINNVSFRPYVIQITTDDGIADNFVVTGNTFSGSAVGRAQGLGNNAAGTDTVNLVVSNNIFKGITDSQQICYWNFNAETTTADLSKNYYDIDIVANPSKIYFNSAAADVEDLIEKGIYPYYAELNNDGTINTNSLVNAPVFVASVNGTKYESLQNAVEAVKDGETIVLISDVVINEQTRAHNSGTYYDGVYYVGDQSFTIDLAGFKITHDGSVNDYLLNFKNVGDKANTITIKNGTVDAGTNAFCALCTSSVQENQLTINLENVSLINNISNGSVAKIRGGAILNVKAGTKITGKNSYLGIESWASTINIDDGAEIYMNGTSSDNGCLVGVGGNGTVNVYGGYGKGAKGGFIAMTSGGTINVSGGEWIANTNGTIGNNSNLYVLTAQNNKDEPGYAGASIINVTGGTFRGGMDAWVLHHDKGEVAELNISGGNFNANPEHYVVDGYAALPDLNSNYVVGVKPTATVNDMGMTTVAAGGYMVYGGGDNTADMPLSFVMQFLADQTADDMANSPFADWYGDFVITFTGIENDSFTADGCYLAGHYGSFGWVKVPVDGLIIEEGARYPVMLGVGLGQNYDYICSSVQDFKCALYLTPEILAANPNLEVKLELAVVDNSKGSDAAAGALVNNENVYSVTNYIYDAEDFVVKNYVAQIGEQKFESLADAVAYAKEQNMTDVVITLIGETNANTKDSFGLAYATQFDSVTINQADPDKTYYLYNLYTGSRTNGGKFIFDGVNIVVTKQYMFEGNVVLSNNSVVKSVADANCFMYYSNTTVEPGSKLFGVIDDYRGGDVIVDGGRTDGQFNAEADMQNAMMIINWSGDSLTIKNGAYVKVNAANEIGRLTVNPGASLNISDSKLDAVEYIAVNGTVNTDADSVITTRKITGAGKIVIDATGKVAGDEVKITADLSEFTGTLEVANNDKLEAKIVDGKIVLSVKPVAMIGETGYATLAAAIAAANTGDEIDLLADISTADTITINKSITLDGNGNTLTYTGTDRAIDVPNTANGANVTVKNLIINAEQANRGINYNTTGKFTVENVTVTIGANVDGYAINLPGSATGADVTIKNSKLTSRTPLNIWGKNAEINVEDTEIISVDNSETYFYSAIQLNKDTYGNAAEGTVVNVTGGKITALDEKGELSFAVTNWTATGVVNISEATEVTGNIKNIVAWIGGVGFVSLQDALKSEYDGTIEILKDFAVSESITVPAGKKATIDLNGKTITGTDNATGSFGLINNRGELTINDSVGTGKITLTATNNRGWNAYSSVISNNPGGKLTVNGGIIEHLGGTDMAYGIDNLTNGKGTYAETIINGGTIKSTYRAIRQFLNGIEAQNILTVKGGTIEGANKSIWMQDPSKNANSGTLNVAANATLKGDVYLTVTAGSTTWPVEVAIAAAALKDDAKVLSSNVPSGYDVANVGGTWGIQTGVAKIGDQYYATFDAAYAAAQANDTITLLADVTASEIITVNKAITLDGNGKTLTSTAARAINVSGANGATIKNLTINASGERAINVINNATNVTIDNVTATAANYTVNVAASAPNAVVAINKSTLNGLCTVNVAAEGAKVTVKDSTINCNDNNTTAGESYAALCLNKAAVGGSIVATDTTVNVTAGSDSTKGRNGAENGTVTINGSTEGVVTTVAVITYEGSDYYYGFTSIDEAIEFAKAGETITLIRDVTASETITINKSVTLDGNGKKLTYTGTNRAIDIPANTNEKVNVTFKDLTVDCAASYCERGINYNDDGALTLEKVTVMGTNVTYALNLPGSSDNTNVVINDSALTGNIALNVWGENATITATNTVFTSVDHTAVENYSAIALNNDGTTNANGTTITINGGKIIARDQNGDPSYAIRNSTATGNVTVSESTEVVGNIAAPVAIVTYGASQFYSCATLQAAIDKAIATNGKVELIAAITLDAPATVSGNVTIDLKGHTLTGNIVLTDAAVVLTAPKGLNVTTDMDDHKVVYDEENKQYRVVAKVYVAQIGEQKFETFEDAIKAAAKDATIEEIVILCDFVQETVENTEDYYHIVGDLKITAAEPVTVKCGIALCVKGGKLTVDENVTIEGLDVVANGYATTGDNMTIEGAIKALSLKQWTSNGTITVTETGSVWLGYGDGQFDMAYGNGTVTINGNGDKTTAQFKAGYSGTRGNGNTLNLNNTYFEAGAWFEVKGTNITINVNNSLLAVSGGDASGALTIDAGNVINVGDGSAVKAGTITGAGKIVIDAAKLTAGPAPVSGNASAFTGEIKVINSDMTAEINENGQIVLVAPAYVASVTDAEGNVTEYTSLAAAVEAADNATVTLLDNIVLDATVTIPADKTVTLDLNGKKIDVALTEDSTTNHIYAFENHGALTITGNGVINARGIFNYGAMTLTSGTINAIDANGGYAVRNYAGASFTMNGGTVATTNEDGDVPGVGYDATTIRVDEGATAVINAGVVNNISNYTFAVENRGITTINGGEFTSGHTVVANYGNLTVNDGNFVCDGFDGQTQHVIWAADGTTTINDGTFDGKDTYNGFNVDASEGAVVKITGGTFLSVHSGSLYGEGTIAVSGGTFFDKVPENRCAEGYIPLDNGDGTYGVKIGKYVASITNAEGNVTKYESLQAAIAAANDGDTIKVLSDIATSEEITNTKKITLDLNGKTITGTDNSTGSYALITNKSELTITGNGTMTLKATNDRDWNAYSSVISNTVGGKLIVENGTIEHLGGTDMAYGIDNLTNGKGTYAETVINGGTVKSTYRAIRMFLNGTEAQNILTVNGGTIEGANKSIWMQDPSKNSNSGKLTVGANATLNGDVYLSVTEGSTEWPVEVSIAASAVNGEVLSNNVPAKYAVANVDGTWKIVPAVATVNGVGYATITDAINAANDGDTVQLLPGTIDEYIAPWAKDTTHASEKSITIVGAENFGTILTGGMYLGYDDSQNRGHKIVVQGIHFQNKGLLVAGQNEVIIENNKFTDITTEVAASGSANANAISVIGKNVNATVKNNVIDGAAVMGINLRDIATATVAGNTITKTGHNSILVEASDSTAVEAVITDNNLSNWGTSKEGRAIRVNGAYNTKINGNVMTHADAPEEFAKVTNATALDGSENYWNGVSPETSDIFLTNLDGFTAVDNLKNYYADAAKTKLIPITKSICWNVNTGVYYEDLSDALAAATSGQTVQMLKDATETYMMIIPGITLDLNGHKLNVSYINVFNGSHVIDSSADNAGILATSAMGNVILPKNNAQLPVWNGEGYKFLQISIATNLQIDTAADMATFRFFIDPEVNKADAKLLAELLKDNGAADHNLSINVRLTYVTTAGLDANVDYCYSQVDVKKMANFLYNGQFGICTAVLRGINSRTEITYSAVVKSGTHAEYVVAGN